MWRSGPRGGALVAASIVGLVATAAILFALRLVVGEFSAVIGPSDADPLFTLYLLEWGAGAWQRGLAGFWDAPFFYPSTGTITLSDHGLLLSLLHLGLKSLGFAAPLSHNLLLVGSFPLTAVAGFLLLRRATRAPRWVVALLALAVTFAPWRWGQLVHLFMLWAPGPLLALWAFDRWLARPRPAGAVTFVGFYAITLLSGCYLAYLFHFSLLAVLLVRSVRLHERAKLVKRWRLLTLCAATAGGIALAVFWPYIQARSELETTRRPQEIRVYAPAASDWIAPHRQNLYRDSFPVEGDHAGRELFPGLLLSLGALLGLTLRRARGAAAPPSTLLARALLAAAVGFVLLTHSAVYLALSKVLPGLDGMRVPTRGHPFVLLGLAVLAARGIVRVRDRGNGRRASPVLALSLAVLLLPELIVRPFAPEGFFPPEGAPATPPHVSWADRDEVRAVAVMPITGDWREARKMWRWRGSGKPIANGYSSFLPPTFRYLRRECRSRDNRLSLRCIAAMRGLGISHAVVEDAWYAAPGSRIEARLGAARAAESVEAARLVFFDAEALVFTLDPAPSAAEEVEQDGARGEAGEMGEPGDAPHR
jgi:hypothetical protein